MSNNTNDDFSNGFELNLPFQDNKRPMKIRMPNAVFSIRMLNPESWEMNGHIGSMAGTIISTDEWIKMQEASLLYLGGEVSRIATSEMIFFWENVVLGVVPNGLRITKPDPITNLR